MENSVETLRNNVKGISIARPVFKLWAKTKSDKKDVNLTSLYMRLHNNDIRVTNEDARNFFQAVADSGYGELVRKNDLISGVRLSATPTEIGRQFLGIDSDASPRTNRNVSARKFRKSTTRNTRREAVSTKNIPGAYFEFTLSGENVRVPMPTNLSAAQLGEYISRLTS